MGDNLQLHVNNASDNSRTKSRKLGANIKGVLIAILSKLDSEWAE